jgi:hypothetical protein
MLIRSERRLVVSSSETTTLVTLLLPPLVAMLTTCNKSCCVLLLVDTSATRGGIVVETECRVPTKHDWYVSPVWQDVSIVDNLSRLAETVLLYIL